MDLHAVARSINDGTKAALGVILTNGASRAAAMTGLNANARHLAEQSRQYRTQLRQCAELLSHETRGATTPERWTQILTEEALRIYVNADQVAVLAELDAQKAAASTR